MPDPTSNRPELSVIVPVWNGEHSLGKLLPRLFTVLGATVKGGTEVLVVLPRGDSATQVVQRAGATVVPFDPPGYGAAFNAGLAADTSDADADGLANLLEYALDTDPRADLQHLLLA